jgi:LacI family transcriptional regulator
MTAIGGLRVLARAGLRVPDDISLIGFDDIHLAEFVNPPLTTVRMSRNDLARSAFGALRAIVTDRDQANSHPREWKVATSLVVRQSTGYPRDSALGSENSAPGSAKSAPGEKPPRRKSRKSE